MKHTLHIKHFALESGESIEGFDLAYEVVGELKQTSSVIWVCHALTANANPLEWWADLFGEDKLFSPQHNQAIICVNILGSCYGSTNGLSIHPKTGKPYLKEFPLISIRDFSRMLDKVRIHLNISKIDVLIGASMGGMHAMEWAISLQEKLHELILLATSAKHSPWGIALNQAQRLAIEADASFGENSSKAGAKGMKAARAMALLSYRTAEIYKLHQSDEYEDVTQEPKAVSYQNYQGEKLVNRFHAYAYYSLSKSMDTHHVGRNRGSIAKALGKITAKTLVISLTTDLLFPPENQAELATLIPHSTLVNIHSEYGHDGFLIETKQIASHIEAFLNKHYEYTY